MTDSVQCNNPDNRVLISISVVDADDKEVSGLEYRSPRSNQGFALGAMNANVALLAAAWAKALSEHCQDEANEMLVSVAGEAND